MGTESLHGTKTSERGTKETFFGGSGSIKILLSSRVDSTGMNESHIFYNLFHLKDNLEKVLLWK